MSIHAQLSTEAQARLKAQQRNSTITSLIISVLAILLVCIVLLYLLLPPIDNTTPQIVSYAGNAEKEVKPEKPKINRAVKPTPTAPSSARAKVIAAQTVSAIAIPVPDVDSPEPSMDFGDGDDIGDGWGDGDGFGSGGGTTFFGTKVQGDRILYIIDYSGSMKGKKDELMRLELEKSIIDLPSDKQFQMIFFAGPAWVAGDEVKMQGGKKAAEVVAAGGKKYGWKSSGGAHGWEFDGKKQQPKWEDADNSQIKKSKKIIKETKLVWGTNWGPPLEMAFEMDPLPNVIVFMTDGSTGSKAMQVAEDFSKLARRKRVIINTISLMEPKARDAMKHLAESTGGTFALIGQDGKKVEDAKGEKDKKKKKK